MPKCKDYFPAVGLIFDRTNGFSNFPMKAWMIIPMSNFAQTKEVVRLLLNDF